MYKISLGMQDETATFTANISQVLSEIRLVKASNAEDREYENGHKGITNLLNFGIKEGVVSAWIAPLMSFVLMIAGGGHRVWRTSGIHRGIDRRRAGCVYPVSDSDRDADDAVNDVLPSFRRPKEQPSEYWKHWMQRKSPFRKVAMW